MKTVHLLLPVCALAFAAPACGSSSSGQEPMTVDASTGGSGGSITPDGSAEAAGNVGDSSTKDTALSDSTDATVDTLADGPLPEGSDAPVEAQAPKPLVGVYTITGNDARWGAYTGQAEVRAGGKVAHLQQWSAADFEGDKIALAWEGTAQGEQLVDGPYPMTFQMERVAFIKDYKGESHEAIDPKVVNYTAQCARVAPTEIDCTFKPDVTSESTYTETWTWVSDPGASPIWANQRTLVDMHDPIPASTKTTLFQTYATFQALPEVQPYVNRPEFQAVLHRQVFDPTDFDFYRANPNVVRSIQRVPDTIGLVEARMRARAFGQTLEQKRAYYEAQMPAHFLNSVGMLVSYMPGATPPNQTLPSGDSMLWTGVYVASQAMRYLVTQDQAAFDNMLTGLHGQLMCHDIVGQPGAFARTIREHQDPLGGWVQGAGVYAAYDWLPTCNNDMLQGYYVAFTWAWMVLKDLPGYAAEKQKMVEIIDDLLSNFSVAADKKGNELKGRALLYFMTKDISEKLQYEALYQGYKIWIVDQGGGSLWEYGTSDWSGNHLIIQGMLVHYMLSQQNNDGHLDELKTGMRHSVERMRHTRLGLYQLIGASLADFPTPPPELEENLWVLREFPAPKINYNFDWRMHPSFCMSPFPSLPWKNDWTTSDRFDSLTGYAKFEQVPDVFAWKQGPFEFRKAVGPYEDPGTDYLFAYWFGRYAGFITPQM